jgi:hypothetical protein
MHYAYTDCSQAHRTMIIQGTSYFSSRSSPISSQSSAPTEIFSRFNIRPSVLYNWKANWTHDAGWRPWNPSAHGIHYGIFTDDEERILADETLKCIHRPWAAIWALGLPRACDGAICPDVPRPCAVPVFGAVKAMCRRLFTVCCHDCEARVAKPDAVAFLREARGRLEARVVEKGWGDLWGRPRGGE